MGSGGSAPTLVDDGVLVDGEGRVVYGAAGFDPTTLPNRPFHGAPVWSRTEDDVDDDGFDDLWLEYRAVDLSGLNSAATKAAWGSALPSSQRVHASWAVTRVEDPSDLDNDGLHNVVDACDDTPLGAARGPEGCPWSP